MEIGPINGGFGSPGVWMTPLAKESSPVIDIDEIAPVGGDAYTASQEESASGMQSEAEDDPTGDDEAESSQPADNTYDSRLSFFA
jgi:hypothetical protein